MDRRHDRRGRLLVVGTPIGNLADLSPRAADALRDADLVVAEDTRVAARLLAHLDLRRPTRSLNEHNTEARLPELLARLAAAETLALTTDAGMPAVSDPGAALVAAARAAGHEVLVVPGPSAVVAAMAVAGVEAPGFVFGGFLPSRPARARLGSLQRLLEAAGVTRLPLVLYEAPHRLHRLLEQLAELVPGAEVSVARELTKVHEEIRTGTAAALAADPPAARGELVVVVSGLTPPPEEGTGVDLEAVAGAALRNGASERAAVEILRSAGVARREAYRVVRDVASGRGGDG